MNYTIPQLRKRFYDLGYVWPDFHLIGIRNKDCALNKYCDTLIVYNGGQMFTYNLTTRPGSYYLLNLLNPSGTAILKPGQYIDTWKIDKHKGEYDAFVQVKPVTVYRDKDKDNIPEINGIQTTGIYGINIHRAGKFSVSKLIDKWSAGCQVIPDPLQFASILGMAKVTGRELFTYTLLDEF